MEAVNTKKIEAISITARLFCLWWKNTEAYSVRNQKSKMEGFAEISIGFQLLTVLGKRFILDVWLGSVNTPLKSFLSFPITSLTWQVEMHIFEEQQTHFPENPLQNIYERNIPYRVPFFSDYFIFCLGNADFPPICPRLE